MYKYSGKKTTKRDTMLDNINTLERIPHKEAGKNLEDMITQKMSVIMGKGKFATDYKKSEYINVHVTIKKVSDTEVYVTKLYEDLNPSNAMKTIPIPNKSFIVVIPKDVPKP